MNVVKRTWLLLAWTVISSLLLQASGAPYDSLNDLYDTNYDYEFGDNQVREEVFITKTPQFVSQPLQLGVNEGQTVRLPCLVDRLEGFVLLWRKNNRIIAVGHQILDKSDPRVTVEDKENGNNLVIANAKHTDEAEYICSVSTYRKTEISHNVQVRVKPVITTSPQEHVTLQEGDSTTLSCHILSGRPIPQLKWRHCEGGQLPSGEKETLNDVIKFDSVTRDDSGCYVCEADNSFTETPVTSKVTLVVEHVPSVHIEKSEDFTEEITVTCHVESQPTALVTWFKDEEVVEDEEGKVIINTRGRENTLKIVDLVEKDFGNYTCVAENKLGQMQDSVLVTGDMLDATIDESDSMYTKESQIQLTPSHKLEKEDYKDKMNIMKRPYRGSFSKIDTLGKVTTLEELSAVDGIGQESQIDKFEGKILYYPNIQSNLISYPDSPIKHDDELNQFKHESGEKETELHMHEYSAESETELQDKGKKHEEIRKGKVYFARTPSVYTLPVKKTEEFSIDSSKPRNAREFLQLLRISQHHYDLPGDDDDMNRFDFSGLNEEVIMNLLRSTHAYDSNLQNEGEKDIKTTSEHEEGNKIDSTKFDEKHEKKATEDVTLEETKAEDDNNFATSNKNIQNKNIIDKKDRQDTESLSRSITEKQMPTHVNGRYLDEQELRIKATGAEDQKTTDNQYTSGNTAVLRGHHSYKKSLGSLNASDIYLTADKPQDNGQSLKQRDSRILKMDNEEKDSNKSLKPADRYKIRNEKTKVEIEEVGSGEVPTDYEESHYKMSDDKNYKASSASTGRYLQPIDDNHTDLNEIKKDIHMEDNERNIKLLRGHHAFKTKLGEQIEQIHHDSNIKVSENNLEEKVRDINDKPQEHDDENNPVNEETMYPKEIMNIEKMYFKQKSTGNIPKHPVLSLEKEMKRHQDNVMPESELTNENELSTNPVVVDANKVDPQDRNEAHSFVDKEPVRKLDDEKNDMDVSIPLLTVHSYRQTLKHNENLQNKDAKKEREKSKENKPRYGPHPFRGIMPRIFFNLRDIAKP